MFLRALGETGTSAAAWRRNPRPTRLRGAAARIVTGIVVLALASAFSACSSSQRQDVTEPAGDFPVQITSSKFPTRQSIAETSDLDLSIKNVGDKVIPNLVVTIYTGEQKAEGAFNIRLNQPGLANPSRPVWILENEYPKVLTAGIKRSQLDKAPGYGVEAGRQNNFQFGTLQPGETREIVWRVTPVKGGTYTVHYQVAAGLEGKAKAVTKDGGPVKGQFVVTISTKPPSTCVNDNGQIVNGNCQL